MPGRKRLFCGAGASGFFEQLRHISADSESERMVVDFIDIGKP